MRALFLSLLFLSGSVFAVEISFTMDDPEVSESPLFSVDKRNQKILDAFKKHKVKGALFVCGMRVDNKEGTKLLKSWDENEHIMANHSYSHLHFPSKKITLENYRDDFLKVEPMISSMKHFTKLYRFPYLKEGDTKKKRDGMREALKKHGYSQGYASIDASDWYIDLRMRERLTKDLNADLTGYRDFYLKHMWERSVFYNELAKKVYGREIKHTVLIHHNLLNALFLDDLMEMYKQKGWKLISAKDAFSDSAYHLQPSILPAGESIVWASAKETGKFEDLLRYPGEDGKYEKDEMDKLGL